jgi:hypothetical protein
LTESIRPRAAEPRGWPSALWRRALFSARTLRRSTSWPRTVGR